jgi:hypothetical protein
MAIIHEAFLQEEITKAIYTLVTPHEDRFFHSEIFNPCSYPNPCLSTHSAGTIGLPLSGPELARLASIYLPTEDHAALSTPFVLTIHDAYMQSPAWATFLQEKIAKPTLAALEFPSTCDCSIRMRTLQFVFNPNQLAGIFEPQAPLPITEETDVIRL